MPLRRPIDTSTPLLTRILATLGPSTDEPDALHKMVESGATMFRLNFSHGSFDEHEARLRAVHQLSDDLGLPLAVVVDIPGPKIRLGEIDGGSLHLETGQDVLIRGDSRHPASGPIRTLSCTYPRIAVEVDPGDRVLINDGAVRLLAVVTDGEQLLCRVTHGGPVHSRKGLNLPDSQLSIPAAAPRDLEIVDWAAAHRADFLAVSFVRRAEDLLVIHERLAAACDLRTGPHHPSSRIPVIAKIETPQAVERFDQIVGACDAIMIARGDLGVELELARVPVVQKELLARTHAHSRPCIVATQMLETMIEHPSPTRAEVSDVANAIYDGTDACMLSGETAVGRFPVLAVEMMRRIMLASEESMRDRPPLERTKHDPSGRRAVLQSLAHGAWRIARDQRASIAVVWSQDGEAARFLSQCGFQMPILALTSDPAAYRRMTLHRAVFPHLVASVPEHRTELARLADATILGRRLARRGDRVVLLAGKPFDDPGATNTVAIRTVGALTESE